jgi:hypothetical protein
MLAYGAKGAATIEKSPAQTLGVFIYCPWDSMRKWLEKRGSALVDAIVADVAVRWLIPAALGILFSLLPSAVVSLGLALAVLVFSVSILKKTSLEKFDHSKLDFVNV